MIKQLKYMAALLAGSALIGTLLLVLVFCIPTGRMESNVVKSADSMIRTAEEVSQDAFSQYIWSERETYTDAIMVQNAIERIKDKNVFEHAMWVYHSDLEEDFWTPEASLKAYCADSEHGGMYLHEYSRYWHGYLVYLKPLLLIFSWEQIVWLEAGLQIVLMAAVAVIAIRKRKAGICVVMAAGFLFMKPILVLISLTMSVCWILTLIALLIMLRHHEKIKEKGWYPLFFMLLGILTSYFDFLTYPAVTLGIPLSCCFIMEEKGNLKENIKQLIGYCVMWAAGYAGMWAAKWVIADITLHTGTIKDAIWSIIGRTEAIGGRPRMNGGLYVIGLNLQEYSAIHAVCAAVITATVLVLTVVGAVRGKMKNTLRTIIPLLLTACIPFAWIIVVQHHSALHARFTFRIIGITMSAVTAAGVTAFRRLKKQ